MKIGIIIGNLGFGGAERVAVNLADWLTDNGDSVIFFNTKKPAEKEYIIATSILRHCCYAENKIKIISKMRQSLKKEKPDVVLVMSTPMCVYAIPALCGLGIPTVVSERSAPGNAKIKKTTRTFSNFLLNFADSFVFQTTGAKEYFNKKIQSKGYIIPNPLVVSELPDHYEGIRSKRFVAIGRLVKEKNYPLMIEAYSEFHKQHSDFILEIYGEGPEKERLQKLINEKKASDYIKLCGARNDVLDHVRDAYAFVLSSDLEGMPNALIEAMALGLPCISTNCPSGGPADLIEDGQNGILVPIADSDRMASAMNLLVEDKELAIRLGKQAYKIRDILDINIIALKWKKVLSGIIK